MKIYSFPLAVFSLTSMAHASLSDFLNSPGVADASNSPWGTSGAASLGMTDGNSDSLTVALQLLAKYAEGKNEAVIGVDWWYSENAGVAETDSFRLHGKYNRLLADHFFYGATGSYLTDKVADIDCRIDLGLGLGYHWIKNDATTLNFTAGPGIAWEKQGVGTSRDITLSFGQNFTHQLRERTRLWQSLAFTPVADDVSDYIFTAEVGLDTVFSDHWALRTSVRYRYDGTPAAGRQSDDTALMMGLSYSLDGFDKEGARTAGSIGSGWDHSIALGFSHTNGNSDSSTMTLSADSSLRTIGEEVFLSADYRFTDNDGTTSADTIRANAQYNRLLIDRAFSGASVGFLRDELAEVNYRVTPTAIFGYYLIKEDNMTLSFEGGPGFAFEEVGGVKDGYFSIIAAEKLTWAINDRISLKQSLSGIFDPSNSDNYTLVADAALDVQLNEKTAWRLAASWAYDGEPAAGRERDDTTVTSGFSVKF
ncbi:MAG: DUF481 domain-containing protein [Akkermansiaceae bacterium]